MAATHHPVILFDGVCNLCNAMVQFVIRHDPKGIFHFCPLQSEAGKKIIAQYHNMQKPADSIFLLKNNKLYSRSTAALKIAQQLKAPFSLLYGFIIVPPFIRNFIYDMVAARRYKWFGRKDDCMIPTPDLQNRFIN